jgi:hypothetical protein
MPLMFHEIVQVRSGMDAQTFLNGIALGQITPGPIVIKAGHHDMMKSQMSKAGHEMMKSHMGKAGHE